MHHLTLLKLLARQPKGWDELMIWVCPSVRDVTQAYTTQDGLNAPFKETWVHLKGIFLRIETSYIPTSSLCPTPIDNTMHDRFQENERILTQTPSQRSNLVLKEAQLNSQEVFVPTFCNFCFCEVLYTFKRELTYY